MKTTHTTGSIRALANAGVLSTDDPIILRKVYSTLSAGRRGMLPVNTTVDMLAVRDTLNTLPRATCDEQLKLLSLALRECGKHDGVFSVALGLGEIEEITLVHQFPHVMATDLCFVRQRGQATPTVIADDDITLALPPFVMHLLKALEAGAPIDFMAELDADVVHSGPEEQPGPGSLNATANELVEAERSGASPEELEKLFDTLSSETKH